MNSIRTRKRSCSPGPSPADEDREIAPRSAGKVCIRIRDKMRAKSKMSIMGRSGHDLKEWDTDTDPSSFEGTAEEILSYTVSGYLAFAALRAPDYKGRARG